MLAGHNARSEDWQRAGGDSPNKSKRAEAGDISSNAAWGGIQMHAKTIAIVGAGLAGLSTGCYAQMNGYSTHIFEHHSKAGGVAAAWRRDGYLIDGGIHFLMGHKPGTVTYRLYEELGIVQCNHFPDMTIYGRFIDEASGKTIDLTFDLDRLEKDLKRIAPVDSKVVENMISDIRRMERADLVGMMSTEKPPELMGLLDKLRMFWRMHRVLRFFRGRYSKPMKDNPLGAQDPLLRKVLENLFLPEVPLWFVLMIMALVANRQMGLLEGGCPDFVEPIERKYRSLGGELTYGAKVEKIVVENGKAVGVRFADGTEHRADIVVSAADGYSTIFGMLGGEFVDDRIKERYQSWKLIKPTIIVSFGVSRTFPGEPPFSSIMVKDPLRIGNDNIPGFGVRIFNYSTKFAPAGKTVVQVLVESSWDYWNNLRSDRARYEAEKKRIAAEVLKRLERYYPGISSRVEVEDVATPYTLWRYTLNHKGAYMSWLPAADKILETIPRTLPGLSNFYMAGQWTTPGGSVPTSLFSGRQLIEVLCNQDGKKFVVPKQEMREP